MKTVVTVLHTLFLLPSFSLVLSKGIPVEEHNIVFNVEYTRFSKQKGLLNTLCFFSMNGTMFVILNEGDGKPQSSKSHDRTKRSKKRKEKEKKNGDGNEKNEGGDRMERKEEKGISGGYLSYEVMRMIDLNTLYIRSIVVENGRNAKISENYYVRKNVETLTFPPHHNPTIPSIAVDSIPSQKDPSPSSPPPSSASTVKHTREGRKRPRKMSLFGDAGAISKEEEVKSVRSSFHMSFSSSTTPLSTPSSSSPSAAALSQTVPKSVTDVHSDDSGHHSARPSATPSFSSRLSLQISPKLHSSGKEKTRKSTESLHSPPSADQSSVEERSDNLRTHTDQIMSEREVSLSLMERSYSVLKSSREEDEKNDTKKKNRKMKKQSEVTTKKEKKVSENGSKGEYFVYNPLWILKVFKVFLCLLMYSHFSITLD